MMAIRRRGGARVGNVGEDVAPDCSHCAGSGKEPSPPTKGQSKALAIMAAMPEHIEWHLHSYAKTGIAEGTLNALCDRGLVKLERYSVKETVRRTGGLSESLVVTWKPRWRARITDAGRAAVVGAVQPRGT